MSLLDPSPSRHVFWKGLELLTFLSLPAWVKPHFSFCGAFGLENNCSTFSVTMLPLQRLHTHINPGAMVSFWPPFQTCPLHLSLRKWWRVIIMTPASHYNDTTSPVHYLQWVTRPEALSIDLSFSSSVVSELWIPPVQHGTHSKWQPQGAFISPAEFNHFFLLSLLSYSEFNEGRTIKGSLWFAEWCRGCLFVSAEGASQWVFMWNERVFFFWSWKGEGGWDLWESARESGGATGHWSVTEATALQIFQVMQRWWGLNWKRIIY